MNIWSQEFNLSSFSPVNFESLYLLNYWTDFQNLFFYLKEETLFYLIMGEYGDFLTTAFLLLRSYYFAFLLLLFYYFAFLLLRFYYSAFLLLRFYYLAF